jgi:hypothetical protein
MRNCNNLRISSPLCLLIALWGMTGERMLLLMGNRLTANSRQLVEKLEVRDVWCVVLRSM